MPLPRFARLPEAKRRHILDAAARRLAAEGLHRASYNAILRDVGISKASAYQYFDSRDDLVDTVLEDLASRTFGALGPWQPSASADEFWRAWDEAAARLSTAADNLGKAAALLPDVAERGGRLPAVADWVQAVLADGQRLGVVRRDLPPGLLLQLTLAVLTTLDRWAADELASGQHPDPVMHRRLLSGLWRLPEN